MNAKTYSVRESEIDRRWYVVDATDETLGRLASRIAHVLEGKHKPTYQPSLDSGDHVIVLNAGRIAVTSNKLESKLYSRHSGYPQGFKQETLGHLLGYVAPEDVPHQFGGFLRLPPRLLDLFVRPTTFRDILEHPHRALRQVTGLYGATAHAAPEELTALASELLFSLMGFAPPELFVHAAHRRVTLVVGIPDPRGLPDLLVALEAKELVEPRVRAHDGAVLDERNAQRCRLENRALLLATHS